MTAISIPLPSATTPVDTVADLLHALGDIPPNRILWNPRPGDAAEADVLVAWERSRRLCELVDGTLVEKPMGYRESLIAGYILYLFHAFNEGRNLGIVTGADGLVRLFPGLVRIPDVAFALWRNIPDGRVPTAAIPDLVPNLVVEVLSRSNTVAEMNRKRGEYLKAGAQLIWIVDPQSRTVVVYTESDPPLTLGHEELLSGGVVLPGFTVPVCDIFAVLDRVQQ